MCFLSPILHRLMISVWICFYFAGGIAYGGDTQTTVQHDLTIRLDPGSHRLDGVDLITLSNHTDAAIDFYLADHLRIKCIESNGRRIEYSFNQGLLQIRIGPHPKPQRLRIEYGGVFNDPVPVQPINADNPGYGVTGTIHDKGVLLLPGAGWYPKAVQADEVIQLTVDAPGGIVAVTSGRDLGHTTADGRTLSLWSIDSNLGGLSLAAGPYKVEMRTFGSITAATYFSEGLQDLAPGYLAATGRYLQLYEALFGPYPFEQFAVVENFFPTGYGFPSFTLMGRRVLQLPFIIHTSLGHEIAHCWWGNGVLVDSSQGNWSEGLTTYVAEYLYKERNSHNQARNYRRQWLRNYTNLVNPARDFPLSAFKSRTDPVTKSVGYDKAAMVFHMLRRTVGDDHFWQTLRDIYAQNRFKVVSWRHLQIAFEHRAGRSLEGFFQQWVFRRGAPDLSLSDLSVTQTANGHTVSGQINQVRPFYDLSVDLAMQTDENTSLQSLAVSGARTRFSLSTKSHPRQLTVDPQVHLFRRLAPEELPPTVNTVKGGSSVLVVVAQHLDVSWMAIAQRLATAMGLYNARIDRENAFSANELADADLILVGLPMDGCLVPMNAAQFAVDARQISLSGQTFSRTEASFFGVFAHPQKKGRVVALFLPVSHALGIALSTKIPHYGKYSYLLFNGPQNQIKGTWPVDTSPLMVSWPQSE